MDHSGKMDNPFHGNPYVWKQFGIDVREGKNIRKDEDGRENFDDFFSDSDGDESELTLTDLESTRASNSIKAKNFRSMHEMSSFSSAPSTGVSTSNEKTRSKELIRPTPRAPDHEIIGKENDNFKSVDQVQSNINVDGNNVSGSLTKNDNTHNTTALYSFHTKKKLRFSEARGSLPADQELITNENLNTTENLASIRDNVPDADRVATSPIPKDTPAQINSPRKSNRLANSPLIEIASDNVNTSLSKSKRKQTKDAFEKTGNDQSFESSENVQRGNNSTPTKDKMNHRKSRLSMIQQLDCNDDGGGGSPDHISRPSVAPIHINDASDEDDASVANKDDAIASDSNDDSKCELPKKRRNASTKTNVAKNSEKKNQGNKVFTPSNRSKFTPQRVPTPTSHSNKNKSAALFDGQDESESSENLADDLEYTDQTGLQQGDQQESDEQSVVNSSQETLINKSRENKKLSMVRSNGKKRLYSPDSDSMIEVLVRAETKKTKEMHEKLRDETEMIKKQSTVGRRVRASATKCKSDKPEVNDKQRTTRSTRSSKKSQNEEVDVVVNKTRKRNVKSLNLSKSNGTDKSPGKKHSVMEKDNDVIDDVFTDDNGSPQNQEEVDVVVNKTRKRNVKSLNLSKSNGTDKSPGKKHSVMEKDNDVIDDVFTDDNGSPQNQEEVDVVVNKTRKRNVKSLNLSKSNGTGKSPGKKHSVMEKDNDVIDDVFTDDNDDNGSPSRNKPKSSQGITEKASNVNDDGAMESDNDEDYYVDVPPDSLSPRVNRISKLKSYTDKNRTGRLSRDSLSEKNNHNKSKSKQQSSLEKSSASTRQLRRSHGADNDSEVSPTKRPKKSTSLKKLSEEDKSPTKSLKGRKRNGVNMKTSNVISTKSPSKKSRDSHEDYSNENHKPISELNEKTEEDNNGIIEDDYITTDNHSDDEYVDIQPAVGEIKKTPVSRFLRQVKGKSNLNRKKKSSLSQKRLSATSFATPHDVRPSPKKSILKSGSTTPRYSTSSPLHIYNVTVSDTPKLPQYQEKDKAENRIVWPSTPPVGLRRSRRVRVKPLAYYKCERIEYENPRKGSGIVGISHPSYASPLRSKKKMSKIKRYAMMHKKKDPTRRLSTHVGLPPDTNFIDNDGHVECIDPTNGDLVAIECLKVKDQYYYVGPSGNEKKDDDALIITKPIYQKSFAMGQIILRPLCEKGLQRVMDLAMSYYVMKGKVAVTIHESTSIIEEGDMFFVPQGNVYNIKNMRRTEAHLVFFQMFRDD